MIIDLTEQNSVLAAACRQAEANARISVLKCHWSMNGGRPPRHFLDEDEIFVPSKSGCCISSPGILITEQKDYSRKVGGKYVVA